MQQGEVKASPAKEIAMYVIRCVNRFNDSYLERWQTAHRTIWGDRRAAKRYPTREAAEHDYLLILADVPADKQETYRIEKA